MSIETKMVPIAICCAECSGLTVVPHLVFFGIEWEPCQTCNGGARVIS